MSNSLSWVSLPRGNVDFFFCDGDQKVKIEQVVADIALEKLSDVQLNAVLKQCHHHFAPLSDGSKKLYLHLKMKGGMMTDDTLPLVQNLSITDANVSDSVVADNIIRIVKDRAYSSVTVQRLRYQFPGENESKPSREIILTPTNWQWVIHLVRAIVVENKTINSNRAVKAILGSDDGEDSKQLVQAYRKNFSFKIIVSLDGLNFYFEPIRDWTTSKVEGIIPVASNENACVLV